MRKFIFVFSIIVCGISQIQAQTVSFEEAKQVAQHFFGKVHKSMQNNVSVSIEGQDTLLYVFNADNGFVVISGEKKAIPVLAYSTESNYDAENVIPPVQMWIDSYQKQLLALRKDESIQQSIPVSKAWQELQTPCKQHKNTTSSSPTPLLTSKWGQGKPYNFYCPQDDKGTNGRVVAGCVATAMAQIMYYFRYPQSGTDSSFYQHEVYGDLFANFSQTTYDYHAMVDRPLDINLATSWLMYHCGVSVSMDYGPDASRASSYAAASALKHHFGFSPETQLVSRRNSSNWDSLLVAHLDKKIPFYYAGTDPSTWGSHAFVCDAYQIDSNDNYYYHFNFGWDGQQDGYFYTDTLLGQNNTLPYFIGQDIIINAFPDTTKTNYPPPVPLTGTTILTEETGSFTHGTIYDCPPNMDYTWIIQPDVDDIIRIQFSMQYQLTEHDTIFITSRNGNINSVFTNDTSTFSILVPDSEITFRLKTTNELTASKGFSSNYITTVKTYCKGPIESYYTTAGAFGDGSGNGRYNNFSSCRYRIIVKGADSITLHFTTFETEKDKDFLYIKDYLPDNTPLLMTLSGSYTDSVFTFNTSELFFVFESDEKNIFQGWEMTYKSNLFVDTLHINQGEKDNHFSIYPNPATNSLYVTVEDISQKGQIEIFDVCGRLLLADIIREKVSQVKLNTLAPGMYFVKITDGNKVRNIKRFIKE